MRRRVFDIREKDLRKMIDAGMSQAAIANAYGCSKKLIQNRQEQFGIFRVVKIDNVDDVIARWKEQRASK